MIQACVTNHESNLASTPQFGGLIPVPQWASQPLSRFFHTRQPLALSGWSSLARECIHMISQEVLIMKNYFSPLSYLKKLEFCN